MARKQWAAQTEITPSLLKFREKRKWQIALRRYVIEKAPAVAYAPYFGLDIESIRKWFEYQFDKGINWDGFGKQWQFDHVIPVTYFDFAEEEELKMCWNFTNLRLEKLQINKEGGNRLDILGAKAYFESLFRETNYPLCRKLIEKIELSEAISIAGQQRFFQEHQDYLQQIENYSSFEFELLNRGRSIDEVRKEIALFTKKN